MEQTGEKDSYFIFEISYLKSLDYPFTVLSIISKIKWRGQIQYIDLRASPQVKTRLELGK